MKSTSAVLTTLSLASMARAAPATGVPGDVSSRQPIYNPWLNQACGGLPPHYQSFWTFPELGECVNMPDIFGSISTSLASISSTEYACGVANCFIQVYNQADCTGADGPNTFGPINNTGSCYTVTNPRTGAVRGGRSLKTVIFT